MRFLADEGFDRMVSEALRAMGHEVLLGTEVSSGKPDTDVLEMARELGAIVLTEDKDFGELVVRRDQPHCGVVLVRVMGVDRPARAVIVCTAIVEHEASLRGRLTLVTRSSVRLRPRPDQEGARAARDTRQHDT